MVIDNRIPQEKIDSPISLSKMLDFNNEDHVDRVNHTNKMKKCCSNVDPKNHCIYNPCCMCVVSEQKKKGKLIKRSNMDKQCRIKYGVNDQMEYFTPKYTNVNSD